MRGAAGDVAVKSSLNSNRAHTRVATTLDVDLLVTDKKRAGQIDLVFSLGLQNHSRRWLAVTGMLTRNVWAKISGIDQAVAQLARNFRFHRAILANGEKAEIGRASCRESE